MSITICEGYKIVVGLFNIKINGVKVPKELIKRPIGFTCDSHGNFEDKTRKLTVCMGENKLEIDFNSRTTIFNNVDITKYLENQKLKRKGLDEKIQKAILNRVDSMQRKREEMASKEISEIVVNICDVEGKYLRGSITSDDLYKQRAKIAKKIEHFENKYTKINNSSKQKDDEATF